MIQKKHQNIIDHYRRWRNQNPDTWIDYTIQQPDIPSAIKVAAKSVNKEGKRNNHQRRLKKKAIDDFTEKLIHKVEEIKKAKSFDDLMYIVESCKVKGIGKLACYDTANRIGYKIGVSPNKIYLHAGTKKGAERLLGRKLMINSIGKNELPEPFINSELDCAELEDILCIYKAVL